MPEMLRILIQILKQRPHCTSVGRYQHRLVLPREGSVVFSTQKSLSRLQHILNIFPIVGTWEFQRILEKQIKFSHAPIMASPFRITWPSRSPKLISWIRASGIVGTSLPPSTRAAVCLARVRGLVKQMSKSTSRNTSPVFFARSIPSCARGISAAPWASYADDSTGVSPCLITYKSISFSTRFQGPSRPFKIFFIAAEISLSSESLVMITEYQGISHRLVAASDLASFVDIKQLIALQDLSAALCQNILNLSCKNCSSEPPY